MPDGPPVRPEDLNEYLLSHAIKDRQMVRSDGRPVGGLPEGATFRPSPTHVDERGSVVELYDTRWNWHPDPLV